MARPLSVLFREARRALDLHQVELATLIGSAGRTVQRWEKGQARPTPDHVRRLANAVEPRNAALAAELDLYAVRPKAAPPVAATPSRLPHHVLLDSVVCAGAEAMALPPQTLRPALRAALVRAREVGLSLDDLVQLLASPAS